MEIKTYKNKVRINLDYSELESLVYDLATAIDCRLSGKTKISPIMAEEYRENINELLGWAEIVESYNNRQDASGSECILHTRYILRHALELVGESIKKEKEE